LPAKVDASLIILNQLMMALAMIPNSKDCDRVIDENDFIQLCTVNTEFNMMGLSILNLIYKQIDSRAHEIKRLFS